MGQTYYKIEGLNLNYLIEKIHKEKIDILNLDKKSDRVIEFSIKNSDKPALVALLKDMCYNVAIKYQTGKPKILGFLISRAALFAGIIIFVFTAVFYSGAIRKITYHKDAHKYQTEISEILKEENLNARNFDSQTLSDKILNAIPQLVFASVFVDGINLNILCIERDNIISQNENDAQDLISEYEGIITKMFVLSGTPMVKIGDMVTKGQVLIKASLGPDENNQKVLAIGEIFIQVNIVYSEYYDLIVDTPYRSGRVYTVTNFSLFGITFKSNTDKKHNFVNFEKQEYTEYLCENMLLPFIRIKEVYYEILYQRETRDFEKVKKIVIAQIQDRALKQIEKDAVVQDSTVQVTDKENRKLITITLQCEKKIT